MELIRYQSGAFRFEGNDYIQLEWKEVKANVKNWADQCGEGILEIIRAKRALNRDRK